MYNYKNAPLSVRLAAIMGISLLLATITYFTADFLTTHKTDEHNRVLAQKAALTVNSYFDDLGAKTRKIADNPDLAGSLGGTVKLVTSLDKPPADDSRYFIRDLFEQLRSGTPEPAAVSQGKQNLIYTATVNNVREAVIVAWPGAPLHQKLQQHLPVHNSLALLQSLDNDTLPLVEINKVATPFRPYTQNLKYLSWRLVIDQPTDIPVAGLLAGGILLLGAALSAFLGLRQFTPRRKTAPAHNMPEPVLRPSDLDSLIGLEDIQPRPVAQNITPPEANVFETPYDDLNEALRSHTLSSPSQPARQKSSVPDPSETPPAETPTIEEALADTDLGTLSNTIEFSLEGFNTTDVLSAELQVNELPESVFRSYDIRGPVDQLTPEVIETCGRAFGALLAAKGMAEAVVGHDARLSSQQYASIFSAALATAGIRVLELGMIPTPAMYHAARKHQGNGFMITASHSAPNYNGIKWVTDNTPPSPEDIRDIYEKAFYREFTSGEGLVMGRSYLKEYLSAVAADLAFARPFRIVIDGLNGVMGTLASSIFEGLECEVVSLHCEPDGNFPLGAPNPSDPAMLADVRQAVIEHQADMGLVFDGDGDRLAVIDNQGEVVSPDQLISLLARMVLETTPGTDIVYDTKCSRLVSAVITENGGRPVLSRTGSTFLRRAILENPDRISMAAEYAGHIVLNDGRGTFGDDGLYAALRLVEWLSWQPETLAGMCSQFPKSYGTPEITIPLEKEDLPAILEELRLQLEKHVDGSLSTVDGIRVDSMNGFGLIRASNTGPFLSARFEANSPENLGDIIGQFADYLQPYSDRLATQLRLHR